MAILQKMAGHKARVCAAYGKGRLRLPADRRASDIAQIASQSAGAYKKSACRFAVSTLCLMV